jgi:hypothetical protein
MRYAKLISGGIVSRTIPKSGYKPFVETVPESRDGYNSYAEYVDDGDAIITVWHYAKQSDREKEKPELTADEALTRYANELTGENDPDLVSATESLITKFTEE